MQVTDGEKFCNCHAYNYKRINIQSMKKNFKYIQAKKEKYLNRKNGHFSKRRTKRPITILKDVQHY